ncbi:restriction endonuclease [Xanthomarina sp. F1114]|uniref:restriction endonuclease n=1 Tax=Xanthomarina sp. F1114 TaxID=2996019 RepID=UPI00225E0027|nr:restriction endonuclease [Xanthomarina sp. F1114]MCX7548347.1 restriction endonuclease [Xanthomarina sp. F1114]
MASKKQDGLIALGGFIAMIGYFMIEYWYIIVPIALFFLGIYLYNERKKRIAKQEYFKAISVSEIDEMDGILFEYYVQKLLINEGYEAEVTKASNDFGVDIIATFENDKIAIQVKRQQSNVSRRAVSDAVAGMNYYDCNKSMVITNSYYSKAAYELASVNYCELVDRDELVQWIIRFQAEDIEE